MDIVIATKNQNKVREIKAILSNHNVLSQSDIGIDSDVEETGKTFSENALLKACAIAKKSGVVTIADDSGLCVDYLNGEPGIYSARYAGENAADDDKIDKLLKNMDGVPYEKRSAQFVCVVAICYPDGESYTFEGKCEGYILTEKRGDNGFGYDPIFYVEEYKKTFAQLSAEIKNKISHRSKALEQLSAFLR